MSKAGYTGSTIMIGQNEIDAQINAQKEMLKDFTGNPRCTCTRCASVFQLKDETKEVNLLNHLQKNGCPFCQGFKWSIKQLNTYLPQSFVINNEQIETMRLPNQAFKRARTINGKWLDAKPKASKGPHSMGRKNEIQKLDY